MSVTAPSLAGPVEDKALLDAAGCKLGGRTDTLDIDRVRAALKLGADPNALTKTARQMSPLGCVTWRLAGRYDKSKALEASAIAKILLAAGATLGPADEGILFFPVANGYLDQVRLLIDNGASLTAEIEGFTPAELALYYHQLAVYDYLVSRGAAPINDNAASNLRLVGGAAEGSIGAMDMALAEGAYIDARAPNGQTALIAALRTPIYDRSEADVIRWLLGHGADPNKEADSGFRDLAGIPLHIFVAMNVHTMTRHETKQIARETLMALLAAGAKVSGMDSQLRTPLHRAADADNLKAAETLIERGARIMARDVNGRTPLDYAESAQMIRLLKNAGATEQ